MSLRCGYSHRDQRKGTLVYRGQREDAEAEKEQPGRLEGQRSKGAKQRFQRKGSCANRIERAPEVKPRISAASSNPPSGYLPKTIESRGSTGSLYTHIPSTLHNSQTWRQPTSIKGCMGTKKKERVKLERVPSR